MPATSFGVITVIDNNHAPLRFTFACRGAFDNFEHECRKRGVHIADAFWGYSLYRTSDDALEALRFWNT